MLDQFPNNYRGVADQPRGHHWLPSAPCEGCGRTRVVVLRGAWPFAIVCPNCDRIDLREQLLRSTVLSRQEGA